MIYGKDENYESYLKFIYSRIKESSIVKTGKAVQHLILDDINGRLTERERLMFILPVIKYEIEHDILTEEVKDELDYYFDLFERNAFEDELGEDEEEQVMHDLYECYEKVFGQD